MFATTSSSDMFLGEWKSTFYIALLTGQVSQSQNLDSIQLVSRISRKTEKLFYIVWHNALLKLHTYDSCFARGLLSTNFASLRIRVTCKTMTFLTCLRFCEETKLPHANDIHFPCLWLISRVWNYIITKRWRKKHDYIWSDSQYNIYRWASVVESERDM